MAPKYKLIYFDSPGRAELTRWIFHYGGVEFEDIRVTREEFFKNETNGQLPVLQVDGVTYNQSYAIARFAARQAGLAGKTDLEDLKIDSVVDTLEDLKKKFGELRTLKDEERAEKKKTLLDETVPYFFGKLNENVQKNGGFMALNRITWADTMFLDIYIRLRNFDTTNSENPLKNYPNLQKVKDTVLQNAGIRNYLKNSKKSEMQTFHIQDEL